MLNVYEQVFLSTGHMLLFPFVTVTFLCLTAARQQQTLYTPGAGFMYTST